jgi:hypothetical protein
MFPSTGHNESSTTTTYKVVLPFYVYASITFFLATIFLVFKTGEITKHYFHPYTLAITHMMALGWGTMIILGSAHQLVPVLIEGKLFSNKLAYASFALAATGIPLLVYGFFSFNLGWPARYGGELIIASIICFLINIGVSIVKSKTESVHAVFVFTATLWLLLTALVGLLLIYNFQYHFLPDDSIDYLPLHAHMGIAGWFLLLIIGVGSRLIPMFLISKYNNVPLLWWIYGLINSGLILFIFIFLQGKSKQFLPAPVLLIVAGILLFARFCYTGYKERIRRKVDEQMKLSLLAVLMMLLPLVFLVIIITLMMTATSENISLVLAYGFVIFFGWITAIILGMTFKTLPFIIWNKVYHHLAGKRKTPNPKDLFNAQVFNWMSLSFVAGFTLFVCSVLFRIFFMQKPAAVLLLITAFLYNWNVLKLISHKPKLI